MYREGSQGEGTAAAMRFALQRVSEFVAGWEGRRCVTWRPLGRPGHLGLS